MDSSSSASHRDAFKRDCLLKVLTDRSAAPYNKAYQHQKGSVCTVPLSKEATEVFALALANPIRPNDCGLVFFGEPGRDRKTHRSYAFNKIFGAIKRYLGLADLHFHDLRHEAISRLAEAGLSDQKVSAISGHKGMQMLKRYTHLRAEDLVEELDRLDGGTNASK